MKYRIGLLFLLCVLLFTSCGTDNTHFFIKNADETDEVTILTREELLKKRNELLQEDDNAQNEDNTDSSDVYWLDSGSVWHVNKNCSYLAGKDESVIYHGSVEKAQNEGKNKVCSRCGGE